MSFHPRDAAKPPLDQGILQVQLLNGGEIHGADRGGMLPPPERRLSGSHNRFRKI